MIRVKAKSWHGLILNVMEGGGACVPKKSCLISYSNLVYKMDQDSLYIQYQISTWIFNLIPSYLIQTLKVKMPSLWKGFLYEKYLEFM